MPDSQNPTTMWTPSGGWQNQPVMSSGYTPSSNPWQITNPNTAPGQPPTINDPTATATPQATSWTSANGLKTTGVMNPFGQTQNNPAFGYFGANPSANVNPWAVNTPPSSGATQTPPNPGVTSMAPPGMQYVNGQLQPIAYNGVTTNPNGAPQDPNALYTPPQTNSLGDPITSGFNGNTPAPGGKTPSGWGTNSSAPNTLSGPPVFGGWGNSTNGSSLQASVTPSQSPTPSVPAGQGPQDTQANTTPVGTVMYDSAGNKVTWNGTGWITDAGTTASSTSTQSPQVTGSTQTVNTPAPTVANTPFQANYLNNVTSGSLDQNGNQQYSPTNPMQFATQDTANQVAKLLGGNAQATNITGPGMGFSQPMQMIGNINAGLAANTLQQNGSQPGSYGRYLLARDQSGSGNFPSYDAWASTQPGYNPGTRNTSNYDTSGNNTAFQQNPQQFAQQNPGQPGGNSTQNTANSTAQQTSLYNNIYSQLAPILSLLQLLGLGNSGGGLNNIQQSPYQPPPPLNINSLRGFPYWSNFA